jgi:hypothetical protein
MHFFTAVEYLLAVIYELSGISEKPIGNDACKDAAHVYPIFIIDPWCKNPRRCAVLFLTKEIRSLMLRSLMLRSLMR